MATEGLVAPLLPLRLTHPIGFHSKVQLQFKFSGYHMSIAARDSRLGIFPGEVFITHAV